MGLLFTIEVFYLWVLLPLYVANAVPQLIWYLRWKDVRRKKRLWLWRLEGPICSDIFGDHRTWFGIGSILLVNPVVALLTGHTSIEGVTLGAGMAFGVLASSFIKRRIGLKPGASAPLLDQLDFVVGADLAWLIVFGSHLPNLALSLFVTMLIHPSVSMLAHRLGVKDKPF